MFRSKYQRDWIEKRHWMENELEQSLRRVSAPEELWNRIQGQHKPAARARTQFIAWATVPVVMFVALLVPHSRNSLQFRSDDPAQVRAWIQANAGMDVPLHSGKLAGASVLSGGEAELAYRIDGRNLSVRVAPGLASFGKTGNSVSWASGGLTYLVACTEPRDLKSCTLCHVGS